MSEQEMSEYLVKCPTCQTQTKMVCEESSPVMIVCGGCDRVLVMHQNRLFTVPMSSVLNIMRQHKVRSCGNVIATKISHGAVDVINEKKMTDLHDLLEQEVDVLDFLRSL